MRLCRATFVIIGMSWAAHVATAQAGGFTGQYFNDIGATSPLTGSPYATRNDSTINFDFLATPAPGNLTGDFSVRWTGKVTARYSEKYLFMTYSVGGVRLTINGQSMIDNWSDHSGEWNWQWIDLQAGITYDIQLDYFARKSGAAIQLWWQSPSVGKVILSPTQLPSWADTASAPKTYYVSMTGNDSNSGLSAAQAWRSVSAVNLRTFNPGDVILFERGGRYAGSLQPRGSGTASASISLGAYGSGALPVIDGKGQESAIRLFNQQYWSIDSLDITGSQRFGVFISGDLANQVLHGFKLTNLTVHDLYATPRWDSGLVMISPMGDRLTFDNVLVDRVTAYNTNLWYGIHAGFNIWYSYPTQPPRSTNITIRNSTVHHVYGDGITFAQTQNVLIDGNVVYETGLAPAGISYTPNGIWGWQADNTVIQFNEGYSTHSYGVDGGVFDIDWGSTNTTIQYNYAHDADGYCVAILGAHNVPTLNSIVRFNICSNNVRNTAKAPWQGDIFMATWDGGTLDGIQIYNNTANWNPATDVGWISGRNLAKNGTLPAFIMNNIVYSRTPTMLDIDGSIPMDRNLYWLATGGTPVWKFGSVVANDLNTFKNMTGQDWNGIFADPMLNDPTYNGVGRPAVPFTLRLQSPAIGAAAGWTGMAVTDFFRNVLPTSGSTTIGAQYVPR
jgi:PA14 domain/Right handed beta helix region